jgi:DNA-binding XRE family transcriptional regulator
MITGTQIRGARAMTGMSIEELANAAGLSTQTVSALEHGTGTGEPQAFLAAKHALEAAGILFIASGNHDEGGPGVRLKARPNGDDGLRPEELNATNDD